MKNHHTCLLLAGLVGVGAFSSAHAQIIPPAGTEGLKIFVGSTAPVIATYRGNSASYSNDLFLALDAFGNPGDDGDFSNDLFIFNNKTSVVGSSVDLGSFAAGTELLFRLHVNNTGYDFFTGPADRNPDDLAHARALAAWQPDETLVSFEDVFNAHGTRLDYDDLVFSFTNTVTDDGVIVPEASTFAAGIATAGLALLGWRRTRRARQTTAAA